MNKTFSLSRFSHYFIYDFRRWAVSYGPTLLLMAAMPLIQYTLILVYSLIFNQTWETPGETTRIVVACITTCLLMLTYPASVYGFVTDKRAGSAFQLIPASVFEKFLSMILNTVFVVPAIFGALYLTLDAIICLVDGTCGGTLFSCAVDGIKAIVSFAFTSDAPIKVSLLSIFMNSSLIALFFLLGALLFKKHKILYPILVIVGLNMLFSMLFGLVFSSGLIDPEILIKWAARRMEPCLMDPNFLNWAIPMYNILATIWDFILFGGFLTAIYFRLKTIKQ